MKRATSRADAQRRARPSQTLQTAAAKFDREAERIVRLVPPPSGDGDDAIALALARRGISLWRAHRRSMSGTSLAASRILLRSLAELQVIVGWLWLRPDVHLRLWRAESARHLATVYREMPATWAGQVIDSTAVAKAVLTQTDRAVTSARGLLADLEKQGKPVAGITQRALIPSTEQMALQLTAAEKGRFADVYRLSVRSGGDWVHSAYTTLIRVDEATGAVLDNEDLRPDMAQDRLEAVGAVVALVWLISDIAGLGLAERCQRFFGDYYNTTLAHVEEFRRSTLESFALKADQEQRW